MPSNAFLNSFVSDFRQSGLQIVIDKTLGHKSERNLKLSIFHDDFAFGGINSDADTNCTVGQGCSESIIPNLIGPYKVHQLTCDQEFNFCILFGETINHKNIQNPAWNNGCIGEAQSDNTTTGGSSQTHLSHLQITDGRVPCLVEALFENIAPSGRTKGLALGRIGFEAAQGSLKIAPHEFEA